ncbi:D-inositol-3-phosphate glycosyltransferase [subsurface metagenome]|nr:glycosyltransferase [Hadesarchaea archaeon]
MRKVSLCVSSQTPPIRFKLDPDALFEKYGDLPKPMPLKMLLEGEDFNYTPGGVTGMVAPMLQRMYRTEKIRKPHWVAINPLSPDMTSFGGIVLHRIELEHYERAGYGHFKEAMWRNIHGLEQTWIPRRHFADYALFNWRYAKKMMDLHAEVNFDLFYVHDFQLLLIGSMTGPATRKLFRWHIPLDMKKMTPEWRAFLRRYLSDYDAIIVSCKKYKRSLSKAGFKGRIYQIYPHIDEKAHGRASNTKVSQFCERFGIGNDDMIILVVARLDPIKGQDTAVRALARIAKQFPTAKLVLVGNGSFSSARTGGLGLPKGVRWLDRLERLASKLGVRQRIIFTRYLTGDELRAAYTRADVVVLPSVLEGFGLAVLEGWIYKKPIVVSSGAGVSELATDGENGCIFPPNDYEELASKITRIFSKPGEANEMGKCGFETAKKCYIKQGAQSLLNVFSDVLGK